MASRRIAFIDHSFHRKTASSKFFSDLLQHEYEVEVFWCDLWRNGKGVDLQEIDGMAFDTVVFWQQLYPLSLLSKLRKIRNVLLVPMYDSVVGRRDLYWLRYAGYKFISFSRTLYDRLTRLGLDCLYLQYFPEPPEGSFSAEDDRVRCFFWQRREDVTWQMAKTLLSGTEVEGVNLHLAPDPPHRVYLPSAADIASYHIICSRWSATRDDYVAKMNEASVFVAPRLHEGIGLAFLEAMAAAKCVVAAHRPTMNEYITDGYNGLLFDPANPRALDFSGIRRIRTNARNFCEAGYSQWLRSIPYLYQYVGQGNLHAKRDHMDWRPRYAGRVTVKWLLSTLLRETFWILRKVLRTKMLCALDRQTTVRQKR